MTEPKWSNEEVLSKINWEGGVEETLRWGLTSAMIEDDALSAEWRRLEDADVETIVANIYDLLDGVDEEA